MFALQRWTLGHTESAVQGRAVIFKNSEAWEHHIGQSDRSLLNVLSTLQVFTNLAAESNMEDTRQDEVLHMIHLLTRFPPTVRVACILMRGATPRLPERAAVAQCLLLFGLILEKAMNMKVSRPNDDAELPSRYVDIGDISKIVSPADMNVLGKRSLRLRRHKSLLCAWLITCLGSNAFTPDPVM
ncbi:hypothetical protein EJ02DRAFT_463777 [Clathrospora elynae]|uniref:Uncharacterized protein n=1 Tax=Clathrospora elynae TaxID=706981 RepID=A0A6A5SZ45_9PLEO|nr:hypothetical protein EJ02DRAFT_463777 [Clathrospora elynae]